MFKCKKYYLCLDLTFVNNPRTPMAHRSPEDWQPELPLCGKGEEAYGNVLWLSLSPQRGQEPQKQGGGMAGYVLSSSHLGVQKQVISLFPWLVGFRLLEIVKKCLYSFQIISKYVHQKANLPHSSSHTPYSFSKVTNPISGLVNISFWFSVHLQPTYWAFYLYQCFLQSFLNWGRHWYFPILFILPITEMNNYSKISL